MAIFRRGNPAPSERVRELRATAHSEERRTLPWPFAAALAAAVTAFAGWALLASICIMGWIMVPETPIHDVLHLAAQTWLLAHGVPAELPGSSLSIIPLGVTGVIALGVVISGHWAVNLARFPRTKSVGQKLAGMASTYLLVYVVIMALAARWACPGSGHQVAVLRAVAVLALTTLAGFARALHWTMRQGLPSLPRWLRGVPAAIGTGLLILTAIGAVVLAISMIVNMSRITLIHDSLQPGVLGSIMLLFGQLAWLPNLILWAAAWATGAGISLGTATVVSPLQSQVGMLPAIPVFGAIPSAGPLPAPMMVWLASSFLAGGASAHLLVKRYIASDAEEPAPVENTTVIGALIAMATGLAFALLQVLAAGDLGATRLVGLGARFPAAFIMVPTAMGVAGMVVGCVLGVRARPGAPAAEEVSTPKEVPVPGKEPVTDGAAADQTPPHPETDQPDSDSGM